MVQPTITLISINCKLYTVNSNKLAPPFLLNIFSQDNLVSVLIWILIYLTSRRVNHPKRSSSDLDNHKDKRGKKPSQYVSADSPLSAFKALKNAKVHPIGVSFNSTLEYQMLHEKHNNPFLKNLEAGQEVSV